MVGVLAGGVAEAVGGPNREYDRDRISLLTLPKELRKFFGGELFSARIEKYQALLSSAAIASAQLEQRGFILERNALDFGVLPQALQIVTCQRLDRRTLRFADPCNGEFNVPVWVGGSCPTLFETVRWWNVKADAIAR